MRSRLLPARRCALLLSAVVASAGLALFWRALVLGETFAERDLGSYHQAVKWLIAPLARHSHDIPLWNPFFGSGQPFAANPHHAFFYPLSALFLLLPFDWAFRLQVILPPLLAVPSMFWFLRVLRRSRPAALLGGLAWGVGGFLLSATNLLPLLFASASLPLTLGFAVRVVRRSGARRASTDLVGLCLCFGFQCLAGEPVTLLASAVLLGAAVLSQPAPGGRCWRGLLGGLALGLLVAAVVLLPGARHARDTIRAAGLSDAMANEWSMPAVRALELFSPHVLGHVDRADPSRYWGSRLYGPKIFALYYSLYPGLLVGVLAVLAWALRARRSWPWIATAVLGYAVALGDGFVLWPLLRHVPGLSGLRYPEKAAVLFVLPVVVAGAQGFDWLVLGRHRRRGWLTGALVALAASGLGLAALLWAVRHALAGQLAVTQAAVDALRVAAVAGGGLVALWLARGWRREARGLLLALLVGLDLVAAGRALVPTVPVASVARPPQWLAPLLAPERGDRDELIFHMAEWHGSFADTGGLAKPPLPARFGLAMTLERDFDFAQLRWTHESTYAWMAVASAHPALVEPLLVRRGVTAIVNFVEGAHWQGDRLLAPDGGPAVRTLIARAAKPFAFAVARVERVHGVAGWKDAVVRLGAQAADSACVEDDQLEPLALPPSPAAITVARESPMSATLQVSVSGPGPAFVAINQTWHPGWRAGIDGSETRLVRTDLALSGVLVPPGQHLVQLDYDDAWLRAGLAISLATMLAGLLVVVGSGVGTRLRRRGRAHGAA